MQTHSWCNDRYGCKWDAFGLLLLTHIVSVASFSGHCNQIIIVSLVANYFSFISNTDLCLFFFLPWEISTCLQKGCCMTLIYNRIPPFLPRGDFFSSLLPTPPHICRCGHQVKALLCSHSCGLNKMNQSVVITHLSKRCTVQENSSQTSFHLNCLTLILATLATDYTEK